MEWPGGKTSRRIGGCYEGGGKRVVSFQQIGLTGRETDLTGIPLKRRLAQGSGGGEKENTGQSFFVEGKIACRKPKGKRVIGFQQGKTRSARR